MPEEFIYRWQRRFRNLNVTLPEHRKMLIDNFVNSIYLYGDKILIEINCIDRLEDIKFSDLEQCSNIKMGSEPHLRYTNLLSIGSMFGYVVYW